MELLNIFWHPFLSFNIRWWTSDRESFDGIWIHFKWRNMLQETFSVAFQHCWSCFNTRSFSSSSGIPRRTPYSARLVLQCKTLSVKQWRTWWLGVACYSFLLKTIEQLVSISSGRLLFHDSLIFLICYRLSLLDNAYSKTQKNTQ